MVRDTTTDGLTLYMNDVYDTAMPTRDEERALAHRVHGQADITARNALVVGHLRYGIQQARRWTWRGAQAGLDLLDLIQEASIGLLSAAENYDGREDVKFVSYAQWWIRQAISRAIELGGVMRKPVHRVQQIRRMQRCTRDLVRTLQHSPTDDELAAAMGCDADIIPRLREWGQAIAYLDAPVSAHDAKSEGDESVLGDFVAGAILSPEQYVEAKEALADTCRTIRRVVGKLSLLPRREQVIFRARCRLNPTFRKITLEEIGEELAVSRERIRQLGDQVWFKLQALGVQGDADWFEATLEKIARLEALTGQHVEVAVLDPPTPTAVREATDSFVALHPFTEAEAVALPIDESETEEPRARTTRMPRPPRALPPRRVRQRRVAQLQTKTITVSGQAVQLFSKDGRRWVSDPSVLGVRAA